MSEKAATIKTETTVIPAIGAPFGGGFFAGLHDLNGERYALIVAPKAEGEKFDLTYKTKSLNKPNGTDIDDDGLYNSEQMNDKTHPAAYFCRLLSISDHTDWYLPSRDELAMIERNLGPNRKRVPELFKAGGSEAFEPRWYWSSTEYASNPYGAWLVGFNVGSQFSSSKDNCYAVRAVRRLSI